MGEASNAPAGSTGRDSVLGGSGALAEELTKAFPDTPYFILEPSAALRRMLQAAALASDARIIRSETDGRWTPIISARNSFWPGCTGANVTPQLPSTALVMRTESRAGSSASRGSPGANTLTSATAAALRRSR